jgi:hypothetical protein
MLEQVAQAQSDNWLHWLYTNAPAAWLSALVASVAFVFALRSRKKPNRVVLREVRNSSLVRVWPSIRHKIKMTFEDRPIETIAQFEAEVFNEGSETIESPAFTLTLPKKCVILDISITPQDPDPKTVIDAHSVTVTLPYLNNAREHGQILKLSLLADGIIDSVVITGTGAGWSIRHVPLFDPKRDYYRLLGTASGFIALILFSVFWYVPFVARRYGIGPNEISWRAFVASVPVLVILIPFGFFVSRFLDGIFHRFLGE